MHDKTETADRLHWFFLHHQHTKIKSAELLLLNNRMSQTLPQDKSIEFNLDNISLSQTQRAEVISYKYTRHFSNTDNLHVQQTGFTITCKTTTAHTLEQSHKPLC